jgi:hypothetical protein
MSSNLFRARLKGDSTSRGMNVVELAAALVLIGIILLLTLRGGAALESMRAYVAVRQIESFQGAVMTYQAEYGSLPGDDPVAPRRYVRAPALASIAGVQASLAGNGILDGKLYDPLTPNGEQYMAWRDLRYFGAVEGDPKVEGASAMPENPFNGFYGFDAGNLGQTKPSLCATRVPGRAAQIIDNRLDDGKIASGDMVATSKFSVADNQHFESPDTEPYNVEKEYIICLPMVP